MRHPYRYRLAPYISTNGSLISLKLTIRPALADIVPLAQMGGTQFAGMVNVESMAGALLIQHYRTELLQPDHVQLYSAASRGYLMHLVPFHLKVGWEMQVFSVTPDASMLRCTINVQNPARVRFVGLFNASNY